MSLLILASLFLALPARAQAVPPGVTGQGVGVASITWTWDAVATSTYDVYDAGMNDLSGTLAAGTSYFTETVDLGAALSTNTQYGVYVKATDTGGGASALSTLAQAYTLAAQPNGSQLLVAGPQANQITMSWNANGNPNGTTYDIDWWVAGSTPSVISTAPVVTGSSVVATIADLPNSQNITISVQARNGDGIGTNFDLFLTTSIPFIFGQASISSGSYALGVSSIDWSWTASTSVVNYQLWSDTGGPVSPLLPPSQLSYVQTGLSTNTAYTDYVVSYGVTNSTDSTPFTQWTLAAPTTGLAVVSLTTATATAVLSWGPNGNPAGTLYHVEWWSAVSSTVTVSTPTTSAVLSPLPGGNTVYFTVQSQNGASPPIVSTFDATYFGVIPSTEFPVSLVSIPSTFQGTLYFLLPTAEVGVTISSYTFSVPVTITAQASTLPAPITGNLQAITANGQNFSIQVQAESGGIALEPSRPVGISITYLAGSLTAPPGDTSIVRYDTVHQAWVALATQKMGNALWGVTDHLSNFSLAQVAPASDESSITVGPNPLRPIVNPGQVMTFRNLPPNARLRIFTYVGEKIFDVTSDASGTVSWDGRNGGGQLVASGVYLVLIEGTGGKKTLRVAVER